ncbi:DUF3152 domain-containing protein [Streptomyces oceani]|uniref:DUF3152 domain-containing protein n=1 Tax=Streptomyces oceani TaxID=1075402 RepID=A0A1E7KQ00_9ACTN|nr:DUF3152 domain-containing protein [Streptomyces oceani]OEV05933.1 hypothetical protein AN216_01305 [Streptomyces oceani]
MGRHSRKRRGAKTDTSAASGASATSEERHRPGSAEARGERHQDARSAGPDASVEPPWRGRMGEGQVPDAGYGAGWQTTRAHGSVFGGVETPPWGSSVFGGPSPSAGPSGGPGPYAYPGASGDEPTRGGHPQHPEPGGAWGTAWGTMAVAGPGTAAEGPRQEYLDAFDTLGGSDTRDDVFAAGAPRRGMPEQRGTGVREQGPPYDPSSPRAGRPAAQGEDGDGAGFVPGHGPGDGDEEPNAPLAAVSPEPGERRRKGRTLTGAAAAAVTTVLAVVVAGQVTSPDEEQRAGAAGEDRASEADSASRSDSRPNPSEPAPVSYAEKMSTVVPLSRELHGPGTFTAVGGQADGVEGAEEVVRYRVDVEKDLPLDAELFAKAVHTTLNDDRSWSRGGQRGFERVASGQADFVITLASPGTTGEWCAKSGLDTTEQTVSCDSAATQRIMINAYRWAQGSRTFGDDLIRKYREMLINHEVGHRLGRDHEYCGGEGERAPVMMQQTKTLTTDGVSCRPNAWPYPDS